MYLHDFWWNFEEYLWVHFITTFILYFYLFLFGLFTLWFEVHLLAHLPCDLRGICLPFTLWFKAYLLTHLHYTLWLFMSPFTMVCVLYYFFLDIMNYNYLWAYLPEPLFVLFLYQTHSYLIETHFSYAKLPISFL